MPDLPRSGPAPAVKPRHMAGTRTGRRGILWPLLFGLLLIIGGGEALVLGLVRQQDAARLAAAPLCAPAQQIGCRLDEPVTVVALATESAGRGGSTRVVKVQTPDGSTQSVYANDHDAGLWSQLHTGEAMQAELWNGSVIRLDDGAGHYLIADDSPVVTSVLFPIIGLLALGMGGILLFFCVRIWRQRTPAR